MGENADFRIHPTDWSNFEIADLDFWRGEAYEAFFAHLEAKGGFYYEVRASSYLFPLFLPFPPLTIPLSCPRASFLFQIPLTPLHSHSDGATPQYTVLPPPSSHGRTRCTSLAILGTSMTTLRIVRGGTSGRGGGALVILFRALVSFSFSFGVFVVVGGVFGMFGIFGFELVACFLAVLWLVFSLH